MVFMVWVCVCLCVYTCVFYLCVCVCLCATYLCIGSEVVHRRGRRWVSGKSQFYVNFFYKHMLFSCLKQGISKKVCNLLDNSKTRCGGTGSCHRTLKTNHAVLLRSTTMSGHDGGKLVHAHTPSVHRLIEIHWMLSLLPPPIGDLWN